MMTYDEFFAEAKRLKCRMLPDDPADVRAIIDAKDAEIESLQEQLRTYGDQRAAEARERVPDVEVLIDDLSEWSRHVVEDTAHSRKDAEAASKLTFEAAWAEMEKRGYRYGRDALAGVKFGWKLHEEWNTAHPPEADKLLKDALEALASLQQTQLR